MSLWKQGHLPRQAPKQALQVGELPGFSVSAALPLWSLEHEVITPCLPVAPGNMQAETVTWDP